MSQADIESRNAMRKQIDVFRSYIVSLPIIERVNILYDCMNWMAADYDAQRNTDGEKCRLFFQELYHQSVDSQNDVSILHNSTIWNMLCTNHHKFLPLKKLLASMVNDKNSAENLS